MSKYINLIDKLTEKDKATITAYINKYGCVEKKFIGIEKWLENWSHSNQKLYKMLGNQFIYEIPFVYEKPEKEVERELDHLYYDENNFRSNYVRFFRESEFITDDDQWKFIKLSNINWIAQNKVPFTIKYRKPNAKKMLQIQEGARWFRAVGQIIEYFKDDWDWDKKEFEELRKQHAIIFSEKTVKGSLCLSIHPLDFMTMSDNSLNWSSCMSWSKDGCYHVGTVEMMNSNNLICAYLKDKKPYIFDEDKTNLETGELIGVWNNKKWRSLVYVTKDIIMTGKPYPYISFELRDKALEIAKELAEKNLKWTYQYGPEIYNDMIHIETNSQMKKQREWMRAKSYTKQNIIWDTKGMYNDMLNDHYTAYMCYRNKVDHTKIISVSGKCTCLSCGGEVLEPARKTWDYNDRYLHTGSVICDACEEEKFRCYYCKTIHPTENFIENSINGRICNSCFNDYLRICPCCGRPAYIDESLGRYFYNPYIYNKMFSKQEKEEIEEKISTYNYKIYDYYDDKLKNYNSAEMDKLFKKENEITLLRIYCCTECSNKIRSMFKKEENSHLLEIKQFWNRPDNWYIVKPKLALPYIWPNLQKVSLEDYRTRKVVV